VSAARNSQRGIRSPEPPALVPVNFCSTAPEILAFPTPQDAPGRPDPICLPTTGPRSPGPAWNPPKRPPFTIPKERLRSILQSPALPRFTVLLREAARAAGTAQPHLQPTATETGQPAGGIRTRRASGADSVPRPQSAPARPSRSASKARKLASLVAAAGRVVLGARRRALIDAMNERAAREEWSARELERRTGLPRRTMKRLAGRRRDLKASVSRLAAAVSNLALTPERKSA
jgi:hypothetical protein